MKKCKTCNQYFELENMKTQNRCLDCNKNKKISQAQSQAKASSCLSKKTNKTVWSNKVDTLQGKKKSKPKKSLNLSSLKKKADRLFSLYIRQKYSDNNGIATCVSCWKKDHYKNMHNAHFIERWCMKRRWEEDNCRPSCISCNSFRKEYHLRMFTIYQVKRLWLEKVEQMSADRYTVHKLRKSDLIKLIEELKNELLHYNK